MVTTAITALLGSEHERDRAPPTPAPRMRLSLTLLNVDPSFCHVRFGQSAVPHSHSARAVCGSAVQRSATRQATWPRERVRHCRSRRWAGPGRIIIIDINRYLLLVRFIRTGERGGAHAEVRRVALRQLCHVPCCTVVWRMPCSPQRATCHAARAMSCVVRCVAGAVVTGRGTWSISRAVLGKAVGHAQLHDRLTSLVCPPPTIHTQMCACVHAMWLRACACARARVCVCVYLSVCPSVCLSVCLSVCV
jgi:hypothetical protein